MKLKLFILISFISFSCQAQEKLINDVKNLQKIKNMPYIPELSGDELFWIAVKGKIDIVPILIESLDDTTETLAMVPNFGGNYTVADIAYVVIKEIIHDIPTLSLIDTSKVDAEAGGYWYYWNYVRASIENRKAFKREVKYWFAKNRDSLIWIETKHVYKTSKNWPFKSNLHPAGGYYSIP
jgi:hypothetical protein